MAPTNPNTPENPLESELRRAAAQAQPRPEFTARLRAGLLAREASIRRQSGRYAWFSAARPVLAQGALVLVLVGLVAMSLVLTPHLFPGVRPGQVTGVTGTALPGQPNLPGPGGLPDGALARLGRGLILALDTSPDGRLAVASTWGVCVYGAGYTEEWCIPSAAGNLRFSPDGRYLALAGLEEDPARITVLDAATGRELGGRTLQSSWMGFIAGSGLFAWDPGGSPRIAVAENTAGEATGARISVYDWQSNTIVWGPVTFSGPVSDPAAAVYLDWALTPAGESLLAAGGADGLEVLDGSTGAVKLRLDPAWQVAPMSKISALRFSPDASWLAYASSGFTVALRWQDGKLAGSKTWQGEWQASRLAWSADKNSSLLAADGKEGVLVYATDSDAPVANFPARTLTPLAWQADGALLYARADGMLGLHSGDQQTPVGLEYTAAPDALAWNSQGDLFSFSSQAINRWDTASGRIGAVGQIPAANPVLLAASADGAQAAYYLEGEAAIQLWDPSNHRALARIESAHRTRQAAFSADGSRLVTIGQDGQLIAWDSASGQKTREINAIPLGSGSNDANALALAPNGVTAALAWTEPSAPDGQNLHLDLWDLERGEKTASTFVSSTVDALAWSPDGKRLAEADSSYVTLWDAALQQLDALGPERYTRPSGETLTGSNAAIRTLAWSPDGQVLAAGGSLVTLYHISDGLPFRSFAGHRGLVRSLAFRADGLVLASGAFDGTILLWDLGAGPQPTATALTATPLPITTPTSAPTGVIPPAPDLSAYQIYTTSSTSPDGQWQAETLFAGATERSAKPMDYHRITVRGPAGQAYAYENWTDSQEIQTHWSPVTWWPLAPEALYWYEMTTRENVCHTSFSGAPRRMDLKTGQVSSVTGFDEKWKGTLAFSPDSGELAYLEGEHGGGVESPPAALVVRDLSDGSAQRVPFTPIDANTWSARMLTFQPGDGDIVLVQQRPNQPMCDGGPVREGVVVFDARQGYAERYRQPIPEGMSFSGYETGGFAILLNGSEERFRMNLASGAVEPMPLSEQEQAAHALWQFLGQLSDYPAAALRYGGSWDELTALNPDIDPQDHAALLRRACEQNGYACLPVNRITTGEERDGFRIYAEFNLPDGRPFHMGGQSQFAFQVKKGADGQYRVMDLPPRAAGAAEALKSFLDLLSAGMRTGDMNLFGKAADLYAGSQRALEADFGGQRSLSELLWAACTEKLDPGTVARCQPPMEIRVEQQLSPVRWRFWVRFEPHGAGSLPDGRARWVPYTVIQGTDGQWRVADLTPSSLGYSSVVTHLTAAEGNGLDDAALIKTLWQEYLEMNRSSYLPDGTRLLNYEIADVSIDPRLENYRAEFNLDAATYVIFSVQSAAMEYSNWVAGNGTIDGSWVRNKTLIVGLLKENGVIHLQVRGTGP